MTALSGYATNCIEDDGVDDNEHLNPRTTINVDLSGLQVGVYTVKFGTQLQKFHKIVKL